MISLAYGILLSWIFFISTCVLDLLVLGFFGSATVASTSLKKSSVSHGSNSPRLFPKIWLSGLGGSLSF